MSRHALWICALAAALSTTACKWTEFDDLADQTWVHSTSKPGVNSTDYGLELLQVQHAGDGGQLAVVGANEPSISTLVYDTHGNTTLGPAPVDLNKEFTINSIPDAPTLISDPDTDNIAYVIPSTEGRTVVLSGAAGALVELTVNDAKPNTAAYIPSGTPGTPSGLLLTGTGTFHGIASQTALTCEAVDDLTAPLDAIAMAIDGANVIVWTSTGKLLQYDLATVSGTCDGSTTTPPTAAPVGTAIDTAFTPGRRSQIVVLDATHVLLAGIPDTTSTGTSETVVYDLTTGMPTNTPATEQGMQSFAVGTMAGTTYAMYGFPTRAVQNVVAGQVEIHEIDLTNDTVLDTIALTLNDDQPESNQTFGQAVAIMHFNDDDIFVIAGDNEIYSYYETNLVPGDLRK